MRQKLREIWYVLRGKYGEKLAERIAQFNVNYGRGKSLFGIPLDIYDLFVRIGMGGLVLDWLSGWKIPFIAIKILVIGLPITFYIIGIIDQRYLKLWKYENRYQLKNRNINPYFEEKFDEMKEEIRKLKVGENK